MLMCGAGALLSKESAVVLPVAALLVDGLAGGPADRRGRRMSAAALAGLALLFLALRLGPMRRDLEVALPLWSGDRLHAFLGACNILVQYVRLAAVPLGLNVEHTPPTGQALSPFWTVAAPAFVAAVVVLAALWWQRWRRAAFGLAWFGLWLLPVCHIVPIANPMAERFMYASLVGLAAGVGVLVGGRPAGALLVAALAALAVLRVPDWRDQRTLHLAAARWNPAAARSVTSLGLAYLEMSPPGEGQGLAGLTEIECRRALAADTKEHLALYMLGNLGNHRAEESRRLGMAERARAEYLSARDRLRAALTLLLREPHFPWTAAQYRDELGVSYWALGDLSRAWTQFSVAARLDPANRVIRGHRDMAEDFLRRKGLLPSANGALPRPGL
jgi:hypothetical protein